MDFVVIGGLKGEEQVVDTEKALSMAYCEGALVEMQVAQRKLTRLKRVGKIQPLKTEIEYGRDKSFGGPQTVISTVLTHQGMGHKAATNSYSIVCPLSVKRSRKVCKRGLHLHMEPALSMKAFNFGPLNVHGSNGWQS